ncbi:zinc-binding dehydrogenase [Allostreptomyces psammosilenae]|uniref:NADPH2:quinone reductase n=1 Tax=Allostreptomyces psammosilenae TaxID=1892865 RepID=A0A853ABG1_9ACTN|nr:zinc-binding dehydrogenase [Allostreptomyces psammosilenae]NYI07828.1 NADPH2:quinone reductase [Allostreptomyces psammosilenae]
MRVVRATAVGGPEVLVAGEAPDPVAGPGQVVVGVSVAGIDFVETQLRRGESPGPALPELPYVPGAVVAGQVLSVGPDVDPDWVGRRVVTHGENGGYLERAVARAENLITVPEALDLADAAALLDDGSTAVGLLEGAPAEPAAWVLVEAAGGGVGSLLVQLARAAGARVIGAARGERKLALVRELGADLAVDYTEPDWAERVRRATGGAGPDLVFDGVGGAIGRAAFGVTARGGTFSVHGAASGASTVIDPEEVRLRRLTVVGLEQLADFLPQVRRRAERALAEAAAGRLRPVVGQTFPLERAADAHAAMESRRVIGKTLLLV